jgi:hypothetical protein
MNTYRTKGEEKRGVVRRGGVLYENGGRDGSEERSHRDGEEGS